MKNQAGSRERCKGSLKALGSFQQRKGEVLYPAEPPGAHDNELCAWHVLGIASVPSVPPAPLVHGEEMGDRASSPWPASGLWGEPLLQTPNPPLQSEGRKGGKEHDGARLRALVEGAFGWRASCFGTSAEGEDAAGAAWLPRRTRSAGSCPRRVCAPGLILQTEGKPSPALPSSPCPALGSARTLPSCKQITYRGEAAPGASGAPEPRTALTL